MNKRDLHEFTEYAIAPRSQSPNDIEAGNFSDSEILRCELLDTAVASQRGKALVRVRLLDDDTQPVYGGWRRPTYKPDPAGCPAGNAGDVVNVAAWRIIAPWADFDLRRHYRHLAYSGQLERELRVSDVRHLPNNQKPHDASGDHYQITTSFARGRRAPARRLLGLPGAHVREMTWTHDLPDSRAVASWLQALDNHPDLAVTITGRPSRGFRGEGSVSGPGNALTSVADDIARRRMTDSRLVVIVVCRDLHATLDAAKAQERESALAGLVAC